MIEEGAKKFDRIIAIFIQLQSKHIVKAQELADRFAVSLRTIYRDIKTLEQAGVPILSEAGAGYSIMEGYKLPPVMFTKEEATGFVAAEKLMEKYVDKSMGEHFKSAMIKIKSVLRWAEKDLLASLDESLHLLPSTEVFSRSANNALEILMNGITKKQQVKVQYQSFDADKPNERILEPIGIFHENGFWYLVSYCLLRKDYRQFRTDRISKIQLLDSPFELQHQHLNYYLKKSIDINDTYIDISILAKKQVTKYMANNKKNYGFINEENKGTKVLMHFKVREAEVKYFTRWYLMFGDALKIVTPVSLKEQVKDLLKSISKNL